MSDQSFESSRLPRLGVALVPIVFLVLLLSVTVYVFGDDSTGGPVQVVLVLSGALAAVVAVAGGSSWVELREGIKKSVYASISAVLLLLLIGALAGSWMLSGIIPTIIYYGLEVLHPVVFLFAACCTSSVVSLATGSSWSTVATVGIALLAIGKALGFSEGMVAGAVISGAYFGDKVSPLSDTTNLAATVAGVDLFKHIRYMLYTTVPSIALTLLLFLGIGFFGTDALHSEDDVQLILRSLDEVFFISPLLFVVPALVVWMILRRVAPMPALLGGTLMGSVAALLAQHAVVAEVGGGEGVYAVALFKGVMKSLYTSVNIATGHPIVDDLLSTRGMSGMLNTVWLILCAVSFGGIMEASGFLRRISVELVRWTSGDASLVTTTTGSCLFFNLTTSDQYLSIIISGKIFERAYRDQGLRPEVLSRTLEDSATVTSVLVPWNTCGATQASVLNVATIAYAPFCFFNIISPFMTVLYAVARVRIRRFSSSPNSDKLLDKSSKRSVDTSSK